MSNARPTASPPSSNLPRARQEVGGIRAVLGSTDARRVARRDLVFFVVFLALAALCFHRQGTTSIDRFLLGGYRPTQSSIVFRIANSLTLLGSPGIVIALGVVAAVFVRFRQGSVAWAVACLAAPGIAGAVEATLKIVIARPRPVTAALTGESGNGFPSGHSAGFAALVFAVAFIFSSRNSAQRGSVKFFLAAATASLVVGSTRVLVGAHYPTDVFAGLLVGVVAADLTAFAARHSSALAGARHDQLADA